MIQLQPRTKEFFADILKSLKALPQRPIREYMSSKPKDGHNPFDDFFNTTFVTLYAEDYYGYIDLSDMLSTASPSTREMYSMLSMDILKTLNEQLSILRAGFNTLKLVDSNGTLHTKFELLLEALIADIKQDILSVIDKTPTVAENQSVDDFSFISTSNNVYIEGIDEPIESQTMQWRFSIEKKK